MGAVTAWTAQRRPITYPAGIDFASNGLLRPGQMRQSMAPGLGMISLHPLASRSWDVLQFNCWHETGQQLTVTSLADAYRNYQRQEATFRARMVDRYNPLTCTNVTRFWQGKTWWLRKGMAQVATPGTSNHGWGLAVDAALWVETSKDRWEIRPVAGNRWLFAWLEANVVDHGFAWNNRTEPWHLEYFAGDDVPERVLNLERLFGIAA